MMHLCLTCCVSHAVSHMLRLTCCVGSVGADAAAPVGGNGRTTHGALRTGIIPRLAEARRRARELMARPRRSRPDTTAASAATVHADRRVRFITHRHVGDADVAAWRSRSKAGRAPA